MSWGYLEDASGAKGHADRICIPKDESELLTELAEARSQGAPVTIAGGGSGLTGGRVPNGGWLISMEKFRRLDVAPGQSRGWRGNHTARTPCRRQAQRTVLSTRSDRNDGVRGRHHRLQFKRIAQLHVWSDAALDRASSRCTPKR